MDPMMRECAGVLEIKGQSFYVAIDERVAKQIKRRYVSQTIKIVSRLKGGAATCGELQRKPLTAACRHWRLGTALRRCRPQILSLCYNHLAREPQDCKPRTDMKLLARLVARQSLDSVNAAKPFSPAARRLSTRPQFRASTCIQCHFRAQLRSYADDSKPTPPPPASFAPPPTSQPQSPESSHELLSEKAQDDLPSTEESRRSLASKRFSHLMDHMQSNIFIASQRLNDLTGYSGIEALKDRISSLESAVTSAQEALRSARAHYKAVVTERASTQREVNTLLARKDSWSPADFERFTQLYRSDYSNEQAVQEAQHSLAEAEKEAEKKAGELSAAILARYHEEQIWSDKIRRMSTWGTWGLMGVNVLLFLVFQFGAEPWRRKRLVSGFEEKVREALERERALKGEFTTAEKENLEIDNAVAASLSQLEEEVSKAATDSDSPAEAGPASEGDISEEERTPVEKLVEEENRPSILDKLRIPATWKAGAQSWQAGAQDLFSERAVTVPKRDITVIALEGAAAGATIAGMLAVLLLRRS